jgi:hypothetical protein
MDFVRNHTLQSEDCSLFSGESSTLRIIQKLVSHTTPDQKRVPSSREGKKSKTHLVQPGGIQQLGTPDVSLDGYQVLRSAAGDKPGSYRRLMFVERSRSSED